MQRAVLEAVAAEAGITTGGWGLGRVLDMPHADIRRAVRALEKRGEVEVLRRPGSVNVALPGQMPDIEARWRATLDSLAAIDDRVTP